MPLLLDTQILLRAAGIPERLSDQARALIEDSNNGLLFSAASLWEITLKRDLGRSDLRVEPEILRRGLTENGYEEPVITSTHATASGGCPLFTKPPSTGSWWHRPKPRAPCCLPRMR